MITSSSVLLFSVMIIVTIVSLFGPMLPTKLTNQRTAVIYVYSHFDNNTIINLQYFVREGMGSTTSATVDYFVVIQGTIGLDELPELQLNGQYIYHENACYDWGTFGWLMFHSGYIDIFLYTHFVFINSSVRGPYIHDVVRPSMDWLQILLSQLTHVSKLVGATISCESTGQAFGLFKQNPHVQSYAMATDVTGLKIMLKAGAFTCRNNRWRTIFYAEVEASAAILQAGYNIASLVNRYRGVDWRSKDVWECNSGISPLNERSFDGGSLHPLDAMFIKVKDQILRAEGFSALMAEQYDQWTRVFKDEAAAIVSNKFLDFRAQKIKAMQDIGSLCFDVPFYTSENTGIAKTLNDTDILAWDHFIHFGQFEGRLFRYSTYARASTTG